MAGLSYMQLYLKFDQVSKKIVGWNFDNVRDAKNINFQMQHWNPAAIFLELHDTKYFKNFTFFFVHRDFALC